MLDNRSRSATDRGAVAAARVVAGRCVDSLRPLCTFHHVPFSVPARYKGVRFDAVTGRERGPLLLRETRSAGKGRRPAAGSSDPGRIDARPRIVLATRSARDDARSVGALRAGAASAQAGRAGRERHSRTRGQLLRSLLLLDLLLVQALGSAEARLDNDGRLGRKHPEDGWPVDLVAQANGGSWLGAGMAQSLKDWVDTRPELFFDLLAFAAGDGELFCTEGNSSSAIRVIASEPRLFSDKRPRDSLLRSS